MTTRPPEDDLYVGYLPAPRADRRFLRIALPLLLLGLVLAAALLAARQRDPGTGTWDLAAPHTVEGALVVDPYPVVWADDGPWLVVSSGKFAATDRVADLAGGGVRLRGQRIERDGRRMLELADAPDAVSGPTEREVSQPPERLPQGGGSVVLAGEIVDSKCFLGVMKPGEGKVHKGCATRCIAGGIPPLFRVRTPTGAERLLLLTDEDGRAANDLVLPFVADPVRIEGRVDTWGTLEVFRARLDTIARLDVREP